MKRFDEIRKEQWELLKVKEDTILFRQWNGGKKDSVHSLILNPKRYNKSIHLKHFWPWQKKRHTLILYKVLESVIGVEIDGNLIYLLKPEEYPETLRNEIALKQQQYEAFIKKANERINACREQWLLLPISMQKRLEYWAKNMELNEENLLSLKTELEFCKEIVHLYNIKPEDICDEIPRWLTQKGYTKDDGGFFREHLWFLKNGYNAFVYDLGVMCGTELTDENFPQFFEKLKFYTIESPWFKKRIDDDMMEEFISAKESKN